MEIGAGHQSELSHWLYPGYFTGCTRATHWLYPGYFRRSHFNGSKIGATCRLPSTFCFNRLEIEVLLPLGGMTKKVARVQSLKGLFARGHDWVRPRRARETVLEEKVSDADLVDQ